MTGQKIECYKCGATLISTRSEEDAMTEYRANFPDFNEFDVLCGECNEEFWKWMAKAHPEVKRKA